MQNVNVYYMHDSNDAFVKENDADKAIMDAKKEILKKFIDDCLKIRDNDGWRKEHSFTIYELIEIAVKLGEKEHIDWQKFDNTENFSLTEEER